MQACSHLSVFELVCQVIKMTILEQSKSFARQFGKEITIDGTSWRYYRLGVGSPVFWLTGGLRRAALGFSFLEKLAMRHTVIAPDYSPVQTISEFDLPPESCTRYSTQKEQAKAVI